MTASGVAVPIDPLELDAAWFTSALSSDPSRMQAQVAAVDVAPLAQQGRASRTYRAQLTLREPAPGVPSSLIVKLSLTDPAYLARRLGLGTYRLEVDFYRLLAPHLGELVPACYFAGADDATGHFALVMEDLSPARPAGDDLDGDLMSAAEALARVHARCSGDERVARVVSRCVLPGMLDQRYIGPSEREITKNLLEAKLQRFELPEVVVAAARAEIENHERFARHLRQRPLTCCHGDAHLSQVLFPSPQGGRLAIIDWQTPHHGSGALDLRALLMTSGLPYDRRRDLERRLLDRYHAALVAEGVADYSREALEHDHRLMLHHRLMTVLMMPHRETPENVELWRTRFLEPLLGPLEDDDYAGLIHAL